MALVGLSVLASTCARAQMGSSPVSGTSANTAKDSNLDAPRTVFTAALKKTLKAKNTKQGETFTAELLDSREYDGSGASGIALPRGTKLVGHVTEVAVRSKDTQESRLGIVFDRAVLRKGTEIPIEAIILELSGPAPMARMPLHTKSSGDNSMARAEGPVYGSSRGARESNPAILAGSDTSASTAVYQIPQTWHASDGRKGHTKVAILISKKGNVQLRKGSLIYLQILTPAST